MGKEITFLIKVVRNGVILAVLYFASVWGTNEDLSFVLCKPIFLFLIFYIFTELAKHYGIDKKIVKDRRKIKTMIL